MDTLIREQLYKQQAPVVETFLASRGCLIKRPLTVLHCINIIFRMEIQYIVLNNRTVLLKEDIGVYGNCAMVDSFSWGIYITQYCSNRWFILVPPNVPVKVNSNHNKIKHKNHCVVCLYLTYSWYKPWCSLKESSTSNK